MTVPLDGSGLSCFRSGRLLAWRKRLVTACSTDPLLAPVTRRGGRRHQFDCRPDTPRYIATSTAVDSADLPSQSLGSRALPAAYQPSPKRRDLPIQEPARTQGESSILANTLSENAYQSESHGHLQDNKPNGPPEQHRQHQHQQQQHRRLSREERERQKQERILAHKRKSIWHIPDQDPGSCAQQQQQLDVRVARPPRGPQAAFKTIRAWRAASGLPASGSLPTISKEVYRGADMRRFNPPPYAPEDPVELLKVLKSMPLPRRRLVIFKGGGYIYEALEDLIEAEGLGHVMRVTNLIRKAHCVLAKARWDTGRPVNLQEHRAGAAKRGLPFLLIKRLDLVEIVQELRPVLIKKGIMKEKASGRPDPAASATAGSAASGDIA